MTKTCYASVASRSAMRRPVSAGTELARCSPSNSSERGGGVCANHRQNAQRRFDASPVPSAIHYQTRLASNFRWRTCACLFRLQAKPDAMSRLGANGACLVTRCLGIALWPYLQRILAETGPEAGTSPLDRNAQSGIWRRDCIRRAHLHSDVPSLAGTYRALRSMRVITGELPDCISPMTSKPKR